MYKGADSMDFLKQYLSEETYNALVKELDGKDVKLANLSQGEYISKGKFEAQSKEYSEAKQLIEQLKGENANNEGLQAKIQAYETQIAQLKIEAEQAKLESAVKVKLLEANAKPQDIDYLLYRINKNGEELAFDEQGNIKRIDDIVSGLKASYASNFETQESKKIEVNVLPKGEDNKVTPDDFAKMSYNERNSLYAQNPDLYRELAQKQ